jgi:hypothetical protein
VIDAASQLYPLAERVAEQNVRFLNAGSVVRWHADAGISQCPHSGSVVASHHDGRGSQLSGFLQSRANVTAIARCRDTDENIAGLAQGLDLAFEDFVESEVVRNRSQHGRIRGQSDGGQGCAGMMKTSHQLGGKMLRVRSATTVSAPENFISA